MEIAFEKEYLRELYYNSKTSDKKHRFQPQIVEKYKDRVDTINNTTMANLEFGFSPTHPGGLLKEEIEYRSISQLQLAKQMELPYTALNDILNQKRPLTANTAILFEAALGISADLLMRMQLRYNMQVARQDKSFARRIAQIRKVAAVF